MTTADGDTATATVTLGVAADAVQSVTQEAVPGETVATGSSTTQDEPVQAQVVSPTGGTVSIEQARETAPAGYAVVGSAFHIEAPVATPEDPLRLTFLIASDEIPEGVDEAALAIFRDGAVINPCSGDGTRATPDPCVVERTRRGGDVLIAVLSSHASDWTIGVRKVATSLVAQPFVLKTTGLKVTIASPLEARLTRADTGVGLAGHELIFRAGTKELCRAVSDATGRARCGNLVSSIQALLGGRYDVEFAGAGIFLPATARGTAVGAAP